MADNRLVSSLDRLVVQAHEISRSMRNLNPRTESYKKLEAQLIEVNDEIQFIKSTR